MKGIIIALAVLLLTVGGVVGNAFYVHHVTTTLGEGVGRLPPTPDPSTTPDAIAALHEEFRGHAPLLGISVSTTVLDRVDESLALLETYASISAEREYQATLTLLCELVTEIARLEKLDLENIL